MACILDRAGTRETPTEDPSTAPATTAASSTAAGTGGASASSVTSVASGSGGSGGSAICGDGKVEGSEACDDGGMKTADGCDGMCAVEMGWSCTGSPSACQKIPYKIVKLSMLKLKIPDKAGYDGNLTTMLCRDIMVSTSPYKVTKDVEITLGIDNSYVSDLVIKLVHPTGAVLGLMSRPGFAEAADKAETAVSTSSNLKSTHPITFKDSAVNDAEGLGSGLSTNQAVCEDDKKCEFFPNPGSVKKPPAKLADFKELDPNGVWKLCVVDVFEDVEPKLEMIELRVLAW
jgi:cysteine-rich repeat protein